MQTGNFLILIKSYFWVLTTLNNEIFLSVCYLERGISECLLSRITSYFWGLLPRITSNFWGLLSRITSLFQGLLPRLTSYFWVLTTSNNELFLSVSVGCEENILLSHSTALQRVCTDWVKVSRELWESLEFITGGLADTSATRTIKASLAILCFWTMIIATAAQLLAVAPAWSFIVTGRPHLRFLQVRWRNNQHSGYQELIEYWLSDGLAGCQDTLGNNIWRLKRNWNNLSDLKLKIETTISAKKEYTFLPWIVLSYHQSIPSSAGIVCAPRIY